MEGGLDRPRARGDAGHGRVGAGCHPRVGAGRGLDDDKKPTVGHYKAIPRFAKWRATVRVCDLSTIAAAEAAYCFAR